MNLAAAVTMIFAPATIPVLMPLTIAYNSTQTVDQLVDAWQSGTLTPSGSELGLAELGLNLLPLVGRVPFIRSSKLTFAMYQGLDWGGQMLVMTAQAQTQIAAIRDLDIAQMAELHAELVKLQQTMHPSDPRLAKLRASVDQRAAAIRQRSVEVWNEVVKQQAVAMVPIRAAAHFERSFASTKIADLKEHGLLVDRPDEPPRYEPQRGQIVGDARQLDLATTNRLVDEQDAHLRALASELAGDLGIPRALVSIHPGEQLALRQSIDAVEVTYPPGTSPTEAMAAWRRQARSVSFGRRRNAEDASRASTAQQHPGARAAGTSASATKPEAPSSSTRPVPTRVHLLGDDTHGRESAKATPLEGYVDVYVYSSADQLTIELLDRDVQLAPRQLAAYLRSRGLGGHKLRLIACSSGEHPLAVAQHIANAHGFEVLAPDNKVWTNDKGEIGIGDKPGDNTGSWQTFRPRAVKPEPGPRPPTPLQQELIPSVLMDDYEPAQATRKPVFDRRLRLDDAPHLLETLQATLGTRVTRDDALVDGVQVVARRKSWLTLETEVRIGPRALLADVLAHGKTVETVTRYNGVLGQLRRLVDLWRRRRSGGETSSYPRGSRGWVTEQELGKLDELILARADFLIGDQVDPVTLDQEIKFLEGRRLHHAEVLREMDETSARETLDGSFTLERPDVGLVTREALVAGYRLPGEAEGANPDWYYYRSSASEPGTYDLARKPEAPFEAPALRARVVGRTFAGFEPASPRATVEIPHDWSAAAVIAHLRATPAFGNYALMVEHHGLASAAVIDGAIQIMLDRRRLSARAEVTTEGVRHDVKEYLRERVLAYLCDPSLDAAASMARMRSMVSGLAPSDRGALAEAWHLTRNHPEAATHVGLSVERSGGKNAGKTERRIVDAVDGKTAIEVKDITGPIDREQLGSYLDLLQRRDQGGGQPQIGKVQYIFTNVEGAIANLKLLGETMTQGEFMGRLQVVAFDRRGKRHVAMDQTEAIALKKLLEEDGQ